MKSLVYLKKHHLMNKENLEKSIGDEVLLVERKISKDTGYEQLYDLSNVSLTAMPENTGFLCFIRIPKCGSSLMTEIFRKLSTEHDYKFMRFEGFKDPFHQNVQVIMKWLVENKQNPFMYAINHMYLNLETNKDAKKFQIENPTYPTIFRDPLEWFASHYYSKYKGTLANPRNESHCKHCFETEKFLGLESCLSNSDFDCEYNKWNYLEYAAGKFLQTHKNGHKAAIAQGCHVMRVARYIVNIVRYFTRYETIF